MNKTFKSILALALMAVAMVFASCSKDDNDPVGPTQQEIETKIIGKWKLDTKEGEQYLTNNKLVLTLNDKHECISSFSREAKPFKGYFWVNKAVAPYTIEGNSLSWSSDADSVSGKMQIAISAISNDEFSYDERIITLKDGNSINEKGLHTYKRVTVDYSLDIIGMWEGIAMTGYETYGNIEARIMYKADGTYTYYKKVDGKWQPLADVTDEWNVDGDWLATRWQNNGSDVMNYEWWDIDYIKDGVMKWSALREKEDGTRFNTTFTWKKVK